MSERVCVICGGKFKSKHSRRKCCGDACSKINALHKKRARRAKRKDANCIICGHKIEYGRTSGITCSEACSKVRKDNTRIKRHIKRPEIGVRAYIKRQLGFDPPDDLVEEATLLRLINRAIKSAD